MRAKWEVVDTYPAHRIIYNNVDVSSLYYADDTLLMSNTVNGLQYMLTNLFQYDRKWRVKFSPSKTVCLTFGESKIKHMENKMLRQWYLGGKTLDVGSSRQLVTSARHVGLSRSAIQYLFTSINAMLVCALSLSWLRIGELVSNSVHIGNLVSKSLQGITDLYRTIASRHVTSARHVGSSRLLVTLHEDTSNSNTTNLKLTNKNTNICQSPPQESFDT